MLRFRFPGMEERVLANVLASCGDDVEEAIRRIEALCVSQQRREEEEEEERRREWVKRCRR